MVEVEVLRHVASLDHLVDNIPMENLLTGEVVESGGDPVGHGGHQLLPIKVLDSVRVVWLF